MRYLLPAILLLAIFAATPLQTTASEEYLSPRAYLYATAPFPEWQDATIWCESRWQPDATNPYSGAAGVAQFMWPTWYWAEDAYGIYGSPYDPWTAIDMMNALWLDGYYYWWDCA